MGLPSSPSSYRKCTIRWHWVQRGLASDGVRSRWVFGGSCPWDVSGASSPWWWVTLSSGYLEWRTLCCPPIVLCSWGSVVYGCYLLPSSFRSSLFVLVLVLCPLYFFGSRITSRILALKSRLPQRSLIPCLSLFHFHSCLLCRHLSELQLDFCFLFVLTLWEGVSRLVS